GGREIPIGLTMIFLALLLTAIVNLHTKQVTTEWGLVFPVLFFTIFWTSERYGHRTRLSSQHLEKFNVRYTPEPDAEKIGVRKRGCRVVPVRDPGNLRHLDRVLEEAGGQDIDVLVPTVKVERDLVATGSNPNFTPDEQKIFTEVVNHAEAHG